MGAVPQGQVPQGHPQRWVAVGAVFTLLQGALQLSGAAVGLSLYSCSLKTSASTVWEMVRLYYFSNIHCNNQYSANGHPYTLDGVNEAAYRTMVIMSFYTALSSIWFIGAILLLVSAMKGKHMHPIVGRNLHYPWILSMAFILTLDAIAAILYCVDLFSTSDFSTVMGLLNIKPGGSVVEFDPDYMSMPPWIMALLTSKGVLLWIIDIAVWIIMLKQFRKLFVLRKQAEFVRAQLATMPAYLWPPELLQKNMAMAPNKDDPAPMEPPPAIPRLVNQDGVLVGTKPPPGSTAQRQSSALQIAARQGFSYERPPSGAWSPSASIPRIPRMTTPQKYGYGGNFSQDTTDNWYTLNESVLPRENDRSSNILQRDNEVFY